MQKLPQDRNIPFTVTATIPLSASRVLRTVISLHVSPPTRNHSERMGTAKSI